MKLSKKQQIINAAIDLFAENGIAKVSLVQIANSLGASTGMVYHYFSNGKYGILTEILKNYEDYITSCIPDKSEWLSPEIGAREILFKLFFSFPEDKAQWLRKVVRIIMSEMYFNEQVAEYAKEFFIRGREGVLTDCFQSLVDSGKIDSLDADSTARFFNRLLFVCAIEDAFLYPYIGNEDLAIKQNDRTVRDCTNIINYILSARS